MWDQLIPALSLSMWEGVPDQPINGTGSGESTWTFFDAPSDGAIRFTKPATMDFTTEPQTQIDWGYSLDGVQYVEELDVGTPYTKSGLLRGVQHFCRWRMQSTSGPGVWSPNYAREADGNYANTVTTTGTATAAAPAFTVNPSIHARLAPNWNVSKGNWYPVSGTLAANEVELSCGLGYTSGYPAPSYTFQWKRDGVDISGATSQTYRRGVYDASAVLTCTITATNASGSTSYTTAGVTCPAETPLPDTKLIDTDFGWEFASDYSAELDYAEANQQGTNPVVHDPTGVIRVEDSDGNLLDQSDTGLLRADKAGAYPSIYLPCKNPAKPGTTYNWTAQYVQDGQRGGRAYQFDIRSVSHTGSSVIGGMLTWTPSTTSSEVTIRELSGSFTIGAGATGTDLDLYIYARNNDNNGGSGGGDPVITRLLIEEA